MENINYTKLVADYMEEHKADWNWFAKTIESNINDACQDEDGENLYVYIMELIPSHYGSFIQHEFCSWFGIEHNKDADMDTVVWDYDQLDTEFAEWLNKHKPEALKGSFYIMTHESDGSLCLWYSIEKQEKPFSEWRKEEGYKRWDEYYNDELIEGKDEDEIREQWDAVIEEYEQDCENNNWKTYMDED